MNRIYTLTIPPSVNHLYRRRGRMTFRTKQYIDWLTENTMNIGATKPHTVYPCSVHLTIVGGKGWRSTRDLDNSLKACIDLMRTVGVLAEDNTQHVSQITVSYVEPKRPKDPAHALLVIY